MSIEPLYRAERQSPAYHLRYTWTCWPSGKRFIDLPPADVLRDLAPAWESDGIRALEAHWSDAMVQIAFSAKPDVSPTRLAARAKGRLQHILRTSGRTQKFSRKLAVRSVGDNRRDHVEAYIAAQVDKEHFADPQFAQAMRDFVYVDSSVDLANPIASARGRYWYNLHLVLVTERRMRIFDQATLRQVSDTCFRVATKKEYAVAAMALLPDHLHLALRGNIDHSPQEIALAFQNNTAYALGQKPIWTESFYAGTFSEYDMQAIRRRSAQRSNGT